MTFYLFFYQKNIRTNITKPEMWKKWKKISKKNYIHINVNNIIIKYFILYYLKNNS